MIQDRNEILDELCERHIKNVLARELGRVLNDIEFMDGEDTRVINIKIGITPINSFFEEFRIEVGASSKLPGSGQAGIIKKNEPF